MEKNIFDMREGISVEREDSDQIIIKKNHYHNAHEIIGIQNGEAEFVINGKSYLVTADDLVVINHLENHEVKSLHHPYRRFIILIQPDYLHTVLNDARLSSLFQHRPKDFHHILSLSREENALFFGILEGMEIAFRLQREYMQTELAAAVQMFFIHLYRNHPDWFPYTNVNGTIHTVSLVQKYVDEHYLEDITLKNTAAMFYMDMYYLSHVFKKFTGFTFKDYLMLQRISKAKDALIREDASVTEACRFSGFGNINHFIRIFKNHVGMTPYQFKRQYKTQKTLTILQNGG